MLRGQANGVDTDPLVNELIAEAQDVSWSPESENWTIGGIFGGLYGSFPMDASGKVTFDSRAMIGYLNATSPQITINGNYLGTNFWVGTESSYADAFAYLLGAGFRFNLGTHLCLLTNLDYLGATPEFLQVASITITGDYRTNSYQQKFGTVNLGVGIGWRW